MLTKKTARVVLLSVGIVVLVVSLLADVIGIGENPGFGKQQTMSTVAGVLITAAGLFFTFKKSKS